LLVQPGDALKVLPGSKVPADGIVIWGTSHVNESMVTGESVPISKEVSSLVIGGTMNLHGIFHIQATKVGSGTVLSQIISLVESAQMSKAPIQKFADYVSTLINSLDYKNSLLTPYCNLKSAKHCFGQLKSAMLLLLLKHWLCLFYLKCLVENHLWKILHLVDAYLA